MDHQKPTILLNFGTLSLGGCWGHPMRQKLNLKDKCQISKPNEYTDNVKSNLTCIFLSVRAKLKKKHFSLGHCVWHSLRFHYFNVIYERSLKWWANCSDFVWLDILHKFGMVARGKNEADVPLFWSLEVHGELTILKK